MFGNVGIKTLGIFFVLVAAGCGASSQYMTTSKNQQLGEPPAGKAQLVVLRPSSYLGGRRFRMTNDKGQFIGHALAGKRFSVSLEPGQHRFYSWGWGKRVASATANVEAGKTYYLLYRVSPGAFKANVHLNALTPGSKHWPKLKEWINSTEHMDVDFAAAQAEFENKDAEVQAKIEDGDNQWQKLSALEQSRRTIEPQHGT